MLYRATDAPGLPALFGPPGALPVNDRWAVGTLRGAYQMGFFPMGDSAEPGSGVALYTSDPRGVMPLGAEWAGHGGRAAAWPRSLRASVRGGCGGRVRVTSDRAFERVVRACAASRRAGADGEGGWINPWIERAYSAMFAAGLAHSVEAWLVEPRPGEGAPARGAEYEGRLIAGLYGVHLGGAFFGESMFHDAAAGVPDAGKVCLVQLVHHLRRRGVRLLDTQVVTPATAALGAIEVPPEAYLARLESALRAQVGWGTLDPAATARELTDPRLCGRPGAP